MPQTLTKYFGTLEYPETDVMRFPSGLPAFEQETEFLTIEPAAQAPMLFLQSLRDWGICFLALPILSIDPEYQLQLTNEDIDSLNLEPGPQPGNGEGIICLALIAIGEDGSISANLLAPIVIHAGNQRGVQAIRSDSLYSHQHVVVKPEPVVVKPEEVCS